jgi:hypothetical protein
MLHGVTSEADSLLVSYNGLRNTLNFIAFHKTPLVGRTPNSFSVYAVVPCFVKINFGPCHISVFYPRRQGFNSRLYRVCFMVRKSSPEADFSPSTFV